MRRTRTTDSQATEPKTTEPKTTEKTPRRMVTSLLAAAAVSALLAGCSRSTTARCVDQNGNVLSDSACPGSGGGYVGGSYVGGGYGGNYGGGRAQPRWVYGGGGGTTPGSRATGFSTSPPSSGSFHTSSGTVVRGGFGGAGEGHGSGGHGGGE